MIEIKLLLIRPDMNQIQHTNVIHKYVEYSTIHDDPFCNMPLINDIFVDILNDIGYPLEIKNERIFTDKDI
jgi:hypothetical protein